MPAILTPNYKNINKPSAVRIAIVGNHDRHDSLLATDNTKILIDEHRLKLDESMLHQIYMIHPEQSEVGV